MILERIELESLIEASDLFTPADIEFAARKGSQRALETVVYGEIDQPQRRGPSPPTIWLPCRETRPTLTEAIVDEFTEDIETIARL